MFLGLIISVVFLMSFPVSAQQSFWGNLTSSETNKCAAPGSFLSQPCEKKSCNNSTCKLEFNAQGHLPNDCPNGQQKRYDVDPNCVMNKNASPGSCIDTMPVSQITRVSETNCYRNAGWSRKRDHRGTDYAAVEGTIVTAAADGKIVWAKPMNRAGRVIVMEHEKSCPCKTSDCDTKYITVYMHLKDYILTSGQVKKGTPIAWVGGSNYIDPYLCDYGHPVGTCEPYGPHLHFEIHSGPWSKGYSKLKEVIINPLCDDIQSFCGGCSYNVEEECLNKTNTNEWTELNECAKESKDVVAPPLNMSTPTPSNALEYLMANNPELYQMHQQEYAKKSSCYYENFLFSSDTCLFCDLFRVLFNTASTISLKTYNALKEGVSSLVVVAFAVWIAWFVLKQISSLEVKKPSKMIQEILVQTFRVLLVLLILKVSYAQILRLTIAPVFETATNYIQALMNAKECSPSAPYMKTIAGFDTEIKDDSTGALPRSMGQNVLCSIKALQDGVGRMIAFGREARCIGWHERRIILRIFPHPGYVLSGDLLIISGFILLLAFPWCLVDCVLNMGIAMALLPAAVGAWAFKITSQYLKTIWNFFMNAVFQFTFLSIILYIIITVVDQFMQPLTLLATDFDGILDPIHGIAFWGVNALKLVMVCLLGWVFLDNAKELAGKFADAPDLGIGRSTGAFFAQAGERAAIGRKVKDPKTGKMVRKGGALGIVKGGLKMGKMAGQHYIGTSLRKTIGEHRSERIKRKALASGTVTTDENGNTIYERTKRNFWGQKITRRVTESADGKMTFSKDREKVMTQIANWGHKKENNARVNWIRKKDAKLLDKFNGQGLKNNEFLTADPDGTKIIKNSKGKIIASMKMNADGSTSLTNKHGASVYDQAGNLLSANRSYRNPLRLFRKQSFSINNADAQTQNQAFAGSENGPENAVITQQIQATSTRVQALLTSKQNGSTQGGIDSLSKELSMLNGAETLALYQQMSQNLTGKQMEEFKKQTVYNLENKFLIKNGEKYQVNAVALQKLNLSDVKGYLATLDKIKETSYNKARVDTLYQALRLREKSLAVNPNLTIQKKGGNFEIKRSTYSLRQGVLRAITPKDSRLHDIATANAVKSERGLTAHVGKTQSVTKDHLVAIREIKDKNGNIIQQDIAFRPDVTKYLIDSNGQLNINMINQLKQGTQLSEEKINLAIANHILKDRGITLNNKFLARDVKFKDGKLTIAQKNLDGSVTNLTTEMKGNQMIVDSKTIDADGTITEIRDNGVMSRVISQKDGKKATVHYGFDYHIRSKTSVSSLINKDGEFLSVDENEAMNGFDESDRQLHAMQVKTGHDQIFKRE